MLPKIGEKLSLSDKAYKVIKEAILNNDLKPREILSEEALATKLGISRTPLRTALKRLEFEKLVNVNSTKNTIVADINMKDIQDAFAVRKILEPAAAAMACVLMKEEDFNTLREMIQQQETIVSSKELVKFMACDREFHLFIARCTDNGVMCEMIERLGTYNQRFCAYLRHLDEFVPLAAKEHIEIYKVLQTKNVELVKSKMIHHIEQVEYRFFNY